MSELFEAIKGQLQDAIEATEGLRPGDAAIHLNNIEAQLEELEHEVAAL